MSVRTLGWTIFLSFYYTNDGIKMWIQESGHHWRPRCEMQFFVYGHIKFHYSFFIILFILYDQSSHARHPLNYLGFRVKAALRTLWLVELFWKLIFPHCFSQCMSWKWCCGYSVCPVGFDMFLPVSVYSFLMLSWTRSGHCFYTVQGVVGGLFLHFSSIVCCLYMPKGSYNLQHAIFALWSLTRQIWWILHW